MAEFDFSQIEAFVSNLSINVSNMDQILRDFSTKTNDAAKEADKLKDTISKTSDNIKKLDTGNVMKELNSFQGQISKGIDVFSKMTLNAGNVLEKFHKLAQNTSDITAQFAGLRNQLEGIDITANFDQVNDKLQQIFDDFDISDISSDIDLKIQTAIDNVDFNKITASLKDLAEQFENMPNLIPIDEIRRSITNIRENLDELPTKIIDENLKGIISERVDAIGSQLDQLQNHFQNIDISTLKEQLNSLNDTPFGAIALKFEQLFQSLNGIEAEISGSLDQILNDLPDMINPEILTMIDSLKETVVTLISNLQDLERSSNEGMLEGIAEVKETLGSILESINQSSSKQVDSLSNLASALNPLKDQLSRQVEILEDLNISPAPVDLSSLESIRLDLTGIMELITALPRAEQLTSEVSKITNVFRSSLNNVIDVIHESTTKVIDKFPDDLGPTTFRTGPLPIPPGPAAAAAPSRGGSSIINEIPDSLRGISDAIENIQIDPEMKKIFRKLSRQDPLKLDREPLKFFEDFVKTAKDSGKLNEQQVKNLEDLSEQLGKLIKYSNNQGKATKFLTKTLEREFSGINRSFSSTFQETLKTLEGIKDRQEALQEVIDESSESGSDAISTNQRAMINVLMTLAKDSNIRAADLLKQVGQLEKGNRGLIQQIDTSISHLMTFMDSDLPKASEFDAIKSSLNALPKAFQDPVISSIAKAQAEQEKKADKSINVAERQAQIAEDLRSQFKISAGEGTRLNEAIENRLGTINDSLTDIDTPLLGAPDFSETESAFADLLSKFEMGSFVGLDADEIHREILNAANRELESLAGGANIVDAFDKKSAEELEALRSKLEIGFTDAFEKHLLSIEAASVATPGKIDRSATDILRKLAGTPATTEDIQERLISELHSLDDLIKTSSSKTDMTQAITKALDLSSEFSGLEDELSLESRKLLVELHRTLGDLDLGINPEGFANLEEAFARFMGEFPDSLSRGSSGTEAKLDESQATMEQVVQNQAEQTEAIEMLARAEGTAADQQRETVEESSEAQQDDLGRAVNTLQRIEDSLGAIAQGETRGEAREAGYGLRQIEVEGVDELGEQFATAQENAADAMIQQAAASAERERNLLEEAAQADAAAAAQYAEQIEELKPILESMDDRLRTLNDTINQGRKETTRYRSE